MEILEKFREKSCRQKLCAANFSSGLRQRLVLFHVPFMVLLGVMWVTVDVKEFYSCHGIVRKLIRSRDNASKVWVKNFVTENCVLLISYFGLCQCILASCMQIYYAIKLTAVWVQVSRRV